MAEYRPLLPSNPDYPHDTCHKCGEHLKRHATCELKTMPGFKSLCPLNPAYLEKQRGDEDPAEDGESSTPGMDALTREFGRRRRSRGDRDGDDVGSRAA